MEAITELVTTDDNLSPISSGNYPSYSAILARTLCSHSRTGRDGNFSVSLEWPTRRSTICVRGELGMRSVWYYCSFPSPIILNIGEASITSSEPQPGLFWVVGIQLGLARLRRVDRTLLQILLSLSFSLSLSLSLSHKCCWFGVRKYSTLIKLPGWLSHGPRRGLFQTWTPQNWDGKH